MTSALRLALGVFDGALLLAAVFLALAGVVVPAIYAGSLGRCYSSGWCSSAGATSR